MRFGLPPYLASLIVSEDLKAAGFDSQRGFVKTVFRSLRPYGGVGCFSVPAEKREAFAGWVKEAGLPNAKLSERAGLSLLTRSGALPGAGQWTHHNANPANTLMSGDKLVKGPLGVLWFGGAGDSLVTETRAGTDFYKPLTPRVAAGRMFIIGPGKLNAMDVYTGRVLWSAPVDNKQVYERRETKRSVQLRSRSRPLVALADAVYVVSGQTVLKLSSETGKVDPGFKFDKKGEWREIVAYKDTLLASAGERLYGLDRGDGEILWEHKTSAPFLFSTLAAGGGKVFCLESPPPPKKDSEKRRGKKPAPKCRIFALDVRKGKPIWSKPTKIANSVIAYSEKHDIVLLGSAAYRGKDGTALRSGRGMGDPYIMRGDTLFTQHRKGYNDGKSSGARDLLTGKPRMAPHPITGTDILWYFARSHGCSRILGGENILTFRSSTTAYYDLTTDGGVTQLVGFRPFCASGSLVPADGVLNAPNLSACGCAYPIYTHMALIRDPEAENWSHYKVSNTPEVNDAYRNTPGYVRRVGLNFGAPGDRRAESGTLWLDYPSIGGWSFDIPVKTDPEKGTKGISCLEYCSS